MIYTASLLLSPQLVMPYAKGTREFALAALVCGVILSAGSFYAARGEWGVRPRSLLGNKLLAASALTWLFGVGLVAWSVVWLVRF